MHNCGAVAELCFAWALDRSPSMSSTSCCATAERAGISDGAAAWCFSVVPQAFAQRQACELALQHQQAGRATVRQELFRFAQGTAQTAFSGKRASLARGVAT